MNRYGPHCKRSCRGCRYYEQCRFPLLVAASAATNAVPAVAADPTATPPVAAVAAVPATTVTFTLKKPLADVGFGRYFWLEIFQSIIPEGPPLQVFLTDSSGATVPVRNHLGDFLRTDSLLEWVRKHDHGEEPMRAYLGSDDLHVTVFNRMKKSDFVPAVLPA